MSLHTQPALIDLFDRFYSELLTQKLNLFKQIQSEDAQPIRTSDLNTIQHRLAQLILNLEAHHVLRYEHRRDSYGQAYEHVRYAMAALADEVMVGLHVPTEASETTVRSAWANSLLLEEKLFGTQIAGTLVFERIEALVGEGLKGWPRSLRQDVARVYLRLIVLGFQGQYGDRTEFVDLEASLVLKESAHQLRGVIEVPTTQIGDGAPVPVAITETTLFPETSAYTIADGEGGALADVKRYQKIAVSVATLALLLSSVVWLVATLTL